MMVSTRKFSQLVFVFIIDFIRLHFAVFVAPVFIAHCGVKCVLEAFHELGGGSIQPLMQFVMKELHGEGDTQQVHCIPLAYCSDISV